MRFKPGDRVKFLNDIGGGVVIRITNKTIYVENQDGFEIPVLEQELLPDTDGSFSTKKQESKNPDRFQSGQKSLVQKSLPEEHGSSRNETTGKPSAEQPIIPSFSNISALSEQEQTKNAADSDCMLWFAWVLQKGGKGADLYLINDSSYQLLYTASCGNSGEPDRLLKTGHLEDGYKASIGSFSREILLRNTKLRFEGIVFKPGLYLPHPPVCSEILIDENAILDSNQHTENDFFDEKALLFSISNAAKIAPGRADSAFTEALSIGEMVVNNLAKGVANLPRQSPSQAKGQHTERPTLHEDENVIDLHIELLVENSEKLTPTEILDMQMARFKISLESAIIRKTPKLIYIHGVGNGKLKFTLRKTLEREYPKVRFQDASFQEYGYGATMVFPK